MEFQEKKTIVNVISGWAILIIYGMYLHNNYYERMYSDPIDLKFWASAFLILIPVSIGARILTHILFGIVNKMATDEDPDFDEDERDKMIELKSDRVSHVLFFLGMFIGMGAVVMDYPQYYLFVIMAIGGSIAETISGARALYLYRRGF